MRAAAIVYVLSAIAILGLGVFLLVTAGMGFGTLVLALTAVGLLVLARGLFQRNARACRGAFATSSFATVGLFLVPLYLYVQVGWAAVSGRWLFIGPILAAAIAHALALMLLFRAKPGAP